MAELRDTTIVRRMGVIICKCWLVWAGVGDELAAMRAELGYAARKLRELHFDVLIALTARAYGAQLITSNGVDFELIRRYREFAVEVW